MPATFASSHLAVGELHARLAERPLATVLDAGAGTGAASLAVRRWYPEARITMIERDAALAAKARELLPDASLIAADLNGMQSLPPHDLVIASYSVGEAGEGLAARLWQAAGMALVIIEPGTPKGFAMIRRIRSLLLERGAHIAAPCPAETPCPIAEPDWCHFGARVERSSLHRRIKGAQLGYEDEKFSYVAFVRESVTPAQARILRRPQQQPGWISLETCTPAGLKSERVLKRDRDAFRLARKAAWGSPWP
jgi:ribosomal protein RSM22 (predicted rRNA methylase)